MSLSPQKKIQATNVYMKDMRSYKKWNADLSMFQISTSQGKLQICTNIMLRQLK